MRARPLGLGVVAWCAAVALTPGEIAAAKRHDPITARTAVALALYVAATVLVLSGLSPKPGAKG